MHGDGAALPKAIPTAHCKDTGDAGEFTKSRRSACGMERSTWWDTERSATSGEVRNDVMGPEQILNGQGKMQQKASILFFCCNMKTEELEGRTTTLCKL